MLDFKALQEIASHWSIQPGWKFEIYQTQFQGPWIAITAKVPNAYNPEETVDLRIKSPLPPMKDEEAFQTWMQWRLRGIANHEVDEWFQKDGKAIFDPHADGVDEKYDPYPKAKVESPVRKSGATVQTGASAKGYWDGARWQFPLPSAETISSHRGIYEEWS